MTERDTPEAPSVIWLQVDQESPDVDDSTWCRDKINDSDVRYVRASVGEACTRAAGAKEPTQEPVAWMRPRDGSGGIKWADGHVEFASAARSPKERFTAAGWTPLYTHPAPAVAPAQVEPQYTYGHCVEHSKPGGCQLHNLHCGYPDCDRKPAVVPSHAPDAAALNLPELTYEEAREIAFRAAKAFRPSYFTGDDFEPHPWVVHAIISGTNPNQRRHAANGNDAFSRQAAPAPAVAPTNAARDVLSERQRQINAERWTPEHDDLHTDSSLAQAAAVYCLCAEGPPKPGTPSELYQTRSWDFNILRAIWPRSWGDVGFSPKERRSNLVRAAALLIAEIERRDRLAAKNAATVKEPNNG